MRALNPTLTGIALAAALCSLACEPPRPTGEARGPALYETCVQCHGEKGEGNVNALAPALAGLPQWYLERQLNNYQNGLRGKHFDDLEGLRMRPMSMAMEEEGDIKLVAAHIATFPADALDQVISDINATGYGLTFGLHTRIDSRVQEIVEAVDAGNVYVNRNQIGAIVESQPFGGEGLSGTGPKAGGPWYAARFRSAGSDDAVPSQEQRGPTGETNRLTRHARAPFLCLGPGEDVANQQAAAIRAIGGNARVEPDMPPASVLLARDIGGAILWGATDDIARAYARALASREGPILPLLTAAPREMDVLLERHLCVDTTASGGNAQLLAEVADDEAA